MTNYVRLQDRIILNHPLSPDCYWWDIYRITTHETGSSDGTRTWIPCKRICQESSDSAAYKPELVSVIHRYSRRTIFEAGVSTSKEGKGLNSHDCCHHQGTRMNDSTDDLIPVSDYKPCLNFFEQMEVISKSRLCLSLKAPDDDMTLEERNALYDFQKQKILNFVELLHDSLLCEHGKVLLCLYQCQ